MHRDGSPARNCRSHLMLSSGGELRTGGENLMVAAERQVVGHNGIASRVEVAPERLSDWDGKSSNCRLQFKNRCLRRTPTSHSAQGRPFILDLARLGHLSCHASPLCDSSIPLFRYSALSELEKRLGGPRRLSECSPSMS